MDLEQFGPYLQIPGQTSEFTIEWLVNATQAAKNACPNCYVSHAPVSPYFGPISSSSSLWAGPLGGYTGLYSRIPSVIDW